MTPIPKAKKHWFAVKVEFNCSNPKCKKLSSEILYMNANNPNPDPIAVAAKSQTYSCRLCKAPMTHGTQVKITVLPVTLAEALASGFKPPMGTAN